MKLYDGRSVLAETPLLIPSFALHRDEQFYPEPERFQPERLDAEFGGAKRFRDAGVFLPFGDGPRGCLGVRVARMIVKAALFEVVRNFEVLLNERTLPDDEMDVFWTMVKSGVLLDFTEIKKHN